MPAMFEGQLDPLISGEEREFIKSRATVLKPAYDKYLISDSLHDFSLPAPSIQLLKSSDIAITLKHSKIATATGKAATDLSITKISDPEADNFMGYSQKENCIVFKGERGLVEHFVDFAEGIAQEKSVSLVMKSQSTVRIPPEGLEFGLSYEEFANRVEVLECAMWIRTSPHDQTEPDESNDLGTLQSHRPNTPKCTSTSDGSRDDGLGQDDFLDEGTANVESPSDNVYSSPLSSPPHESSGSSSPLSPPPERIVTPPWLKHSES
ncbi:hypothetical protein FSARC_9906 [Fusarium sarcochroum]|uniref:Uncharacterized protein n=1 Tax=Fusarium sarcochroum TaxID=1208366 RepID=A0A8H4TQ09_9HYPO|nr:hypothetical protein FSARC_9906 [Fusarium sarcochroum]